jgi:hypothetical protein
MATSTEPEGTPPAAKGSKGEANRKRSSEQGQGGQGGAGSGGGGGGGWQKRKKKEVFIYGNYKNYYGYRVRAKPPPFVLSPCPRVVASCSTICLTVGSGVRGVCVFRFNWVGSD